MRYASAQAAEVTGGVTADLENGRADVDASVLASGTIAGARVTAANSIALADLVFATARGEALKQKHIAGDTTAATQTADAAIAAAKVVYDNAVISANVIAAGTIGDAAIQLASDTGTNAKTAVDTWGSLASTLVGATNLLESSFTTGLNSAYATWTTGSVTAQMSSLLASGQAQQALIAADGLANATWMAAMGAADVAKATAKTTAENGFVQAEITRIGTNPATMVSLIGSSSIASSFTGLGSDTSAAQSWIDWATAYAPARLAESTATAQATAALASDRWLAESVLNNAQASADIAWIGNLALPVLAKANGDATASNALDSSLVSDGSSLLSGLTTAVATRGSAGAQSVKLQAVDEATALKSYLVALAGLAPGASTTVAKKAYDDALAIARRDDKVRQADADKTNALSQVVSARTFVGSLGSDVKGYRDSLAGSEYVETMAFAPLLATRNQAYDGAEAGKLLALTTAENTWRNSTATAWANRTGSDFSARATALAGLSTRAGTVFHASQSAIESARSGWWTSHKPAYLQWNIDVNTAESSFTQSLATAKTTLSAALNTAALAFASTDALAIKTHDLALSLVDQTYTTEIANANQTFANAKSTADRDLTVALAIAESNLAVSGDQSAYGTAVNAANAAYATAIDSATTIRDTAKQAAKDKRADDSSLVNKTLADDETLAEKTYDLAESAARSAETHTQALARKTRQTNIAALDSAYATLRDQSWSTSLSTATSTRTDQWTVQARQQAAAKATRMASVSTATSTHDAALASYLADWTNSNIDAKTLAINARATAIATSSGAKNLANYNFGTNAPVSIGGITGSGTVTGSGQSPFAFVGMDTEERSSDVASELPGAAANETPSRPKSTRGNRKELSPGEPGYQLQEYTKRVNAAMDVSHFNMANPVSDAFFVRMGFTYAFYGVFYESAASFAASHDQMRDAAQQAAANTANPIEASIYGAIEGALNIDETVLHGTNRVAQAAVLSPALRLPGVASVMASPTVARVGLGAGAVGVLAEIANDGLTPQTTADLFLAGVVLPNSKLVQNAPNSGRYSYDPATGRYRDATTGQFVAQRELPFPPNRGFATSSRGTVQPGTTIDRYGRPDGRFAGNPGDTLSQRGLPAGSDSLEYHRYEVLKPIDAEIGPAAGVPDFGASGGGTQYFFGRSIADLIREEFLREIQWFLTNQLCG